MTPAGGDESGFGSPARVHRSCRSGRQMRPPVLPSGGPSTSRGSGCVLLPPRARSLARPRTRARGAARTRYPEHHVETLRPGDSSSWRERVSVPSRSSRCEAARSRGSVEERPVHTGEVAGSIPAGTTEIDSDERHPRRGAFFRTLMKSLSVRGTRSGGSPASAYFLRTATAPSGSTTRVVWAQLWCLWPKCA